jgi:hypothetical protein
MLFVGDATIVYGRAFVIVQADNMGSHPFGPFYRKAEVTRKKEKALRFKISELQS